ncbi:MAG: hypothetical protein ACI4VP_03535 [Clostridia bacterium]
MKKVAKRIFYKRISMLLLIMLLCNFLLPQVSFGAVDLVTPLSRFFCAVGDITISTLQKYIVGTGAIKYSGSEEYTLKYSPGVIFSGTLPAFDINFISPIPNKEKYVIIEPEKIVSYKQTAVTSFYSEDSNNATVIYKTINGTGTSTSIIDTMVNYTKDPTNIPEENKQYKDGEDLIRKTDVISYASSLQETYGYYDETTIKKVQNEDIKLEEDFKEYSWWLIENEDSKEATQYTIYLSHKVHYESDPMSVTQVYEVEITETLLENQSAMVSVASVMKNTIASWYKAMQEIALVGLLCVLVYVAIRIIISSSTTDKAKYKKMLFDWFTAVVIIFTLHYIISFTLTATKAISDVFNVNLIADDGSDIVFSKLRTDVGEGDLGAVFLKMVMYYWLIILTIKYTIQYFKRVVNMAFLTMIAPIIGLTYPLDKIKDGQAQAFTLWIREYIFNALLQPFHLIIYYVFVGSSVMGNFATENPFYALAVMTFLAPAEKLLRKMFGFDKGGKLGNLEAALGGATVMNMINSLGKKPPKRRNEPLIQETNGGNIRMKDNSVDMSDPYQALRRKWYLYCSAYK